MLCDVFDYQLINMCFKKNKLQIPFSFIFLKYFSDSFVYKVS